MMNEEWLLKQLRAVGDGALGHGEDDIAVLVWEASGEEFRN